MNFLKPFTVKESMPENHSPDNDPFFYISKTLNVLRMPCNK